MMNPSLEPEKVPSESEVIYSPVEFAKRIGCSTKTLNRWAKNGWLVPYYKPSKRPFYTSKHYTQYLEKCRDNSQSNQSFG